MQFNNDLFKPNESTNLKIRIIRPEIFFVLIFVLHFFEEFLNGTKV